jgi:hypothetical protein
LLAHWWHAGTVDEKSSTFGSGEFVTSTPPVDNRPTVTCPGCGLETPDLSFCVRCGTTLGSARPAKHRIWRKEFAAAPRERTWAPHIISTLFPQLPDHDMAGFGIALFVGLAVIVVLAAARLYPIALTVACALLPILMVLYLYSADIYEREPLRVIGATMLWGAIVGVGLGLWLHNVGVSLDPKGLNQFSDADTWVRLVAVPLTGFALAVVGLIPLLRYRRYNDVLDGTTFGAATGITVVCVQTIVQAWPLLYAGFRPHGATAQWTVELIEVALLLPLIWAASVGMSGAALWLRFRAPVRDRTKLGPVGNPIVALISAAVILVAAYIGWQELTLWPGLVFLAFVAAAGVVALRYAIHVGLVEESDEIEIGPDVVCANCHRETPLHTFCARCGVALKALPKAPPAGENQ